MGIHGKCGGLTVAGQDKNPDWLIVRGDVSGLAEYSTKPTLINSGISVKEVKKKVNKSQIQIYVITTLTSKKYPDPTIYGVDITGIKKGKYVIQYLNPDGSVIDLKEVENSLKTFRNNPMHTVIRISSGYGWGYF